MIPEASTREPETSIDIYAATDALGALAKALGYPTSYADQHLIIHTGEDTFLSIMRLGSGYYWGTFSDYSNIQPGYIAAPLGIATLTSELVKHSPLTQ